MRKFYLLITALFYFHLSWSNIFQPVEDYTVRNGLSHADVTCIHIDRFGFVWIGTANGLNRFDGYTFHNYFANPKDTASLANNFIISIKEDPSGNLFVCTSTGISQYNVRNDNFSSVYLQQNAAVNSSMSTIQDFDLDAVHGYLYVLTENFLIRQSLKDKSRQKVKLSDKRDPFFDFITLIHGSNDLILGSKGKLYIYRPDKKDIMPLFNVLNKAISEDGGIKGAITISNDVAVIYTENHIWKFEIDKNTVSPVLLRKSEKNSPQIISIRKYNGRILDILTGEGMLQYDIRDDREVKFFSLHYPSDLSLSVSSFIRDKNNVLWIGTDAGLLKYNLYNPVFRNIDIADLGVKDQYITSTAFDRNEMLWLGLNKGELLIIDSGIYFSNAKVIARYQFNGEINCISRNVNNDMLLSTSRGLFFFHITPGINYRSDLNRHKIFLANKNVYSASSDELFTSLIAAEDGIYELNYENNKVVKLPELSNIIFGEPVLGISISPEYTWIVQAYRIIQLTKKRDQHSFISFSQTGRGDMPLINTTFPDGLYSLIIGTSGGMYEYDARSHGIKLFDSVYFGNNSAVHAITKDLHGRFWFSTNNGLLALDNETGKIKHFDYNDGLSIQVFADRLFAKSPKGKLAFGNMHSVTMFEPDSLFIKGHSPRVIITEGELYHKGIYESENLIDRDTLEIGPGYRYLKVSFSTMDFWAPEKNIYRYSLEKTGKPLQWINLNNQNSLILSNLPAGYYKLCILGANSNGDWSAGRAELVLHIVAPIWQRPVAYALYVIIGILILYFTVVLRTKHLLKLNREYREREIISKKIEFQSEELIIKNKNITDSLNYARRIQMALMPSQKVFRKYFPDSFILHMPKDIVSGDFYWINEVNNRVFFAAVDCTGHGVPGAFMSIIGFELLRRITEIDKKRQPADILNNLSRGFETIFRDVENITLRDGMDMAFCAVDKNKKTLEFAGAFNPLYLVRDNTITEIKGDRFSVGLQNDYLEETNNFTNHIIPLLEGDILYIFTDGLADQFGGPEGKKYKYRRFRHLLLAVHQLSMEQQVEFLRRSIVDWKGDQDQVDDILVMGIKISKQST